MAYLLIACILLLSACTPKQNEYITIRIDVNMLPVRIIPEQNLDCVIIDKNGKAYTDESWFKLVK